MRWSELPLQYPTKALKGQKRAAPPASPPLSAISTVSAADPLAVNNKMSKFPHNFSVLFNLIFLKLSTGKTNVQYLYTNECTS